MAKTIFKTFNFTLMPVVLPPVMTKKLVLVCKMKLIFLHFFLVLIVIKATIIFEKFHLWGK